MSRSKAISVIGCGYVGLTTAVILSNCGYKVYAVEVNPERLKSIQAGKSFFYEEGIDALLQAGLKNGSFIATHSMKDSVPNSDVVFSCVGTPDNPDGSSNLTYVFQAAQQAGAVMKHGAIYVQKSTVPVGTGHKIETLHKELGKIIHYVSNPEFLREGTAISDTLLPDRVISGGNDTNAVKTVLDIYKSVELNRDKLAKIAGINIPESTSPKYISTSRNSAELIKVTANAFLALKISFANSIAKLADQVDADVVDVMDAVGSDYRIGRAFLNAGRGYGGGCFPKDVSGLIRSAEEFGISLEIMSAASDVNNSMPHYIIAKTKQQTGENLAGKRIAVLGLSFKAGTSDARRSPAVAIANTLDASGAKVAAYDPQASHEARPELNPTITIAKDVEDAVRDTECIFVTTDWPEFVDYDLKKLKGQSDAHVIVDCMNRLDKRTVEEAGFTYIGVGR